MSLSQTQREIVLGGLDRCQGIARPWRPLRSTLTAIAHPRVRR